MVACIFLFLLAYEVVILKGPLTDKKLATTTDSSISNSVTAHASVHLHRDQLQEDDDEGSLPKPPLTPAAPSNPPPSPSHASMSKPRTPVSFESGTTTADRVRAAAKALPADENADPPPYRPLRKHKRPPLGIKSVKVLKERKPVPASALHLESQAADADDDDPDDDPDIKGKPSASSKKSRSSSRSSSRTSPSARPSRLKSASSEKNADADIDADPPKTRNGGKIGEGGAEPGAGQNFWQWFQDNKGSEKGAVSNAITCPEENKRLCQMFYKYLRKYKIRCIFDASCAVNVEWMPEILQKAGNELWGFKYYCSVTDEAKMATAKEKLSSLNFVEFIPDHWWRDGFPDDTELLFAWDTLPHIAYGRVWNFFVKAKKQEIKYILVDNYPGIMNDPVSQQLFHQCSATQKGTFGDHAWLLTFFASLFIQFSHSFQSPKRNYLNLRKHPFRFPAAKEVVQNVTEPGETAKRQLLFYEGSTLPDNLQ